MYGSVISPFAPRYELLAKVSRTSFPPQTPPITKKTVILLSPQYAIIIVRTSQRLPPCIRCP